MGKKADIQMKLHLFQKLPEIDTFMKVFTSFAENAIFSEILLRLAT